MHKLWYIMDTYNIHNSIVNNFLINYIHNSVMTVQNSVMDI